jgi:hypothetical protein
MLEEDAEKKLQLRSRIALGLDVRCTVRLSLSLAVACLELLLSILRVTGVKQQC